MKIQFAIPALTVVLIASSACIAQIKNEGNINPPVGTVQIDTIHLGHKIFAFRYFNGEQYAYGSSIQEFPTRFEYDAIEFTSYDTTGPYLFEPFLFAKINGKWGFKVLFYEGWLTGHIFDEISHDLIDGKYFLVRSGNKWGIYDFGSGSLNVDTQFDEIIVDYEKNKNASVSSIYARKGDHFANFNINLNKSIYVSWAAPFSWSIDVVLTKMKIHIRKLNKINFPEDVYKIGEVIGKHQEENLEFIEVEKNDMKGVVIHDLRMNQYQCSSVFALYDSIQFVESAGSVMTYQNGKVGLFNPAREMLFYTIYDSILFNGEGEYEAWLNGIRDDKTVLYYD